MTAGVQDIDLGWRDLVKRVGELGGLRVEAGVFDEDDPLVAAYAVINEFGSDKANIPERPAFRAAIDANADKYQRILAGIAIDVMKGSNAHVALEGLGRIVQSDIRRSIEQLDDPENAQSTVDAKKGDNPLVDTGDLLKAVKSKVVPA